VSAVFWGLAGLWALLAVINFASFAAGKDRRGWQGDGASRPWIVVPRLYTVATR
jgi:hypothetical protein